MEDVDADGVMLEISDNGNWPEPNDPKRRYYSGKYVKWKATQIFSETPESGRLSAGHVEEFGDFTLTGIAPPRSAAQLGLTRSNCYEQPVVWKQVGKPSLPALGLLFVQDRDQDIGRTLILPCSDEPLLAVGLWDAMLLLSCKIFAPSLSAHSLICCSRRSTSHSSP